MQLIYLIIIFIGCFFVGCTSENGRQLRDADAIMEENPDRAMTLLKEIDRHSLNGNDLPYYALLYTQAQVKTDIPLDSDSLVSIAYKKYGADSRGDRGIRSNFYTGEVFFNQKKYRESMKYYLSAYENSKRQDNIYWQAKSAERMADLLFFAYDYDEAIIYSQEAAELFKRVGRQLNHRYTLAQLARIYLNNGYYGEAYALLDSLKTLCLKESPLDSSFLNYIKLPLVNAIINTGKINDICLDSINFFSEEMSDLEIIEAAILQSEAYNAIDRSKDVINILNNIKGLAQLPEDKVHILYAQYVNSKAHGDNSTAISLVDSMLYYQNKVAEDIIKQSVTGAQRDFYSEMSLHNENKSHILKWVVFGSSFVFILLIVFVITVSLYKSKAQKNKLEAAFEALLSLKNASEQVSREKETLEQLVKKIGSENDIIIDKMHDLECEKNQQEIDHAIIVENLFKEKWLTLDTLCDQYFGLNNSELKAKDLVSNIEKELKKIVSKKGLAEIVEAVDIYMGGIVTNLRKQCLFLKESDINFIALLYAGFSVRAVCMFTGIKYQHFYVKKSRLLKRIQASDASDKYKFLEKIK